MTNIVASWFGDSFSLLHPLLQKLHREGGELSGRVPLEYGSGLAGLIGKRLAPKMGLPLTSGQLDFNVNIKHSEEFLFWNRVFSHHLNMNSIFKPYGVYPKGYWREMTGKLSIDLGVEIKDGGWVWVYRKISFYGMPLPLCLFPQSHAYKKIVDGKYFFSVTFSLPIMGKLLSYSGSLDAK